MKKSKQAYYDKYLERNWNNTKNTWKGIKSLISLKTVASHVPTVFSLDNGDTKKSIKYSHKHFSDEQLSNEKKHLSNETRSTIFLQPTDKEEIVTYPLSTPIRLLAQIVYLIEYYLFY